MKGQKKKNNVLLFSLRGRGRDGIAKCNTIHVHVCFTNNWPFQMNALL